MSSSQEPDYLKTKAGNLDEALANALEAENLGITCQRDARAVVQSPDVRRAPHRKVRLFDGLEYTGLFVGQVNEKGEPHGLGTFKETRGFSLGGVMGSGGGKIIEGAIRSGP